MKNIINLLRYQSLNPIDMDTEERLSIHYRILSQKRILSQVFQEFHKLFHKVDLRFLSSQGVRVEIGAGVAPMKHSYPDVLATDIVPGPGLDRVIDAEAMDFDDNTVRVVFAQNCFHHLGNPEHFFHELERILMRGGGAILLEPYYGPFASFLFKRLFKTEGYDKQYPSWNTPRSGPMNGANQALSYIIFIRDREKFEREFPELEIVYQAPCNNFLKYLFSGGLNFRQLCPDFAIPLINVIQWILSPFTRLLALHHIIVLRKKQ